MSCNIFCSDCGCVCRDLRGCDRNCENPQGNNAALRESCNCEPNLHHPHILRTRSILCSKSDSKTRINNKINSAHRQQFYKMFQSPWSNIISTITCLAKWWTAALSCLPAEHSPTFPVSCCTCPNLLELSCYHQIQNKHMFTKMTELMRSNIKYSIFFTAFRRVCFGTWGCKLFLLLKNVSRSVSTLWPHFPVCDSQPK